MTKENSKKSSSLFQFHKEEDGKWEGKKQYTTQTKIHVVLVTGRPDGVTAHKHDVFKPTQSQGLMKRNRIKNNAQ